MNALHRLKSRLTSSPQPETSPAWADTSSIDRHIKDLERQVREGQGTYVSKNLQQEALKKYWVDRRVDSFKDARLLAFGIALPIGLENSRIIEEEQRLSVLVKAVNEYRASPRRFRRCYQGLLSGYLSYDPNATDAPEGAFTNWKKLRQYLKENVSGTKEPGFNPRWVDVLQQHTSIFDDNPCSTYGLALLHGDQVAVNELRDVLGIPDSSWFMRELYMAQVEAAVSLPDPAFLEVLNRVVALLRDNQIIRDKGLSEILNRYAQIENPTLQTALRDFAVELWGNPWLQSNAPRWGRVSAPARKLVTEWLKLEFVEAFFSVLSEQGAGDKRRLNFWKRYIHAIDDIHFALGTRARASLSRDLVALRKKASGLTVSLENPGNAFIMQMGRVVVVEFSSESNACYGYSTTSVLPFAFNKPLRFAVDAENSLKHRINEFRLRHQDGLNNYAMWEERFEAELERYGARAAGFVVNRRRIQLDPVAPQTQTPSVEVSRRSTTGPFTFDKLVEFVLLHDLRVEDLRPRGGNLWVHTGNLRSEVNETLLRWGFAFKPERRGWWRSGN